MPGYGSAVSDLGLGSNLASQVDDQTEEEKRRKRLGMMQGSDAVSALFGYGRTGIAPMQLGMGKGAGY